MGTTRTQMVRTYSDDVLARILRKGNGLFVEWQKAFARWLVETQRTERRVPVVERRLAKLEELEGTPWTKTRYLVLMDSALFSDYYRALRERGERALRDEAMETSFKARKYLDWALDSAKDAADYEAIPKIAAPLFAVALPRNQIAAQQAHITITLGDKAKVIAEAETMQSLPAETISLEPEILDEEDA